jgi:serine protease Do
MSEPQITNYPDFTKLMANEGIKVVHINAVQKANPTALNPLELLKRLLPPEDAEEAEKELKKDTRKEKPQTGIGSGFFISKDGYILTNAHVVNKADAITVKTTDRKEFKATLVGLDVRTDIALLKIDSATATPTVRTGKPKALKAGEWVAAIGSPFGFENTVTAGIVSAFNRYLPDDNYLPFIQTDVAINPGNSGGPLFNVQGEVVGINTQIYTRSGGYMGMSFSIPIDAALRIADQLRQKGKLERSRIGVRIESMHSELAKALGLSITNGVAILYVEPGGPAAKAGLTQGDVVVAYQNEAVYTPQEITRLISETPAGTTVPLKVVRGKEEKIINVTVVNSDALIATDTKTSHQPEIIVEQPTGPLGFVLDGNKVVYVSDTAKQVGLAVGDHVVQIQQTKIETSLDVQKWLSSNKDFENVAVFVRRKNEPRFIILPRSESN